MKNAKFAVMAQAYTGEYVAMPVSGYINNIGTLGIYKEEIKKGTIRWNQVFQKDETRWHIVHIPSGHGFFHFPKKKDAVDVVKAIEAENEKLPISLDSPKFSLDPDNADNCRRMLQRNRDVVMQCFRKK